MALHQFIEEHRAEILDLCRKQIAESASGKGKASESEDSLPELLDDIVAALRSDVGLARETSLTTPEKSATTHGLRRWKLGFTITELIHDYGAVCHVLTTMAEKDETIAAHEFRTLNQMLDLAIADSVAEYSDQQERRASEETAVHLGFVAHELRNAISAAILAFEAIRHGQVGTAGRTSDILERSLKRLRILIDRSLTEVRLKSGSAISRELTKFRALVGEVEASASLEALSKSTRIVVDAGPDLEAYVDRQMITSAISNLLQNAIKYSPRGAEVKLRYRASTGMKDGVCIEVEDECGGIDESKVGELFGPFVRGHADAGGLGLGLGITRQAVEAHGGAIQARSLPGKGCVFVIDLPGK